MPVGIAFSMPVTAFRIMSYTHKFSTQRYTILTSASIVIVELPKSSLHVPGCFKFYMDTIANTNTVRTTESESESSSTCNKARAQRRLHIFWKVATETTTRLAFLQLPSDIHLAQSRFCEETGMAVENRFFLADYMQNGDARVSMAIFW